MPRVYTLYREQLIHRPLADVFAFFAQPENLESITPPSLKFKILTPRPIAMQPGSLIEYRLKLFGIPFHWKTRIESFEPLSRFIDTQATGLYRRWHHTHEFRAVPEGTLIVDRVEYELPLGLLGRLAHALFVRRSLNGIFDHREDRIRWLFEDQFREVSRPGRATESVKL